MHDAYVVAFTMLVSLLAAYDEQMFAIEYIPSMFHWLLVFPMYRQIDSIF